MGSFIVPGLIMLTMITQAISNGVFGWNVLFDFHADFFLEPPMRLS